MGLKRFKTLSQWWLMYVKVVIEIKKAWDAWQNVSERGRVDPVAGKVGNGL